MNPVLSCIFILFFLSACFKEDRQKPVIRLNGSAQMSHPLGLPYLDPGYIAEDDRDGDITRFVTISGNIIVDFADRYFLTYNITDASGNKAAPKTRLVYVKHRPASLKGVYFSSNTCTPAGGTGHFTVINAESGGQISFSNLISNTDSTLFSGVLSGNLSEIITIPETASGDSLISGRGNIDPAEKQINLQLLITYNADTDTCDLTLSR